MEYVRRPVQLALAGVGETQTNAGDIGMCERKNSSRMWVEG